MLLLLGHHIEKQVFCACLFNMYTFQNKDVVIFSIIIIIIINIIHEANIVVVYVKSHDLVHEKKVCNSQIYIYPNDPL